MVNKIKKLKKIRFHSEGRDQLFYGAVLIILVALLLWFGFTTKIPFIAFLLVFGVAYGLVVNFYRCPIRISRQKTPRILSWHLPTERLLSLRRLTRMNISMTAV